MPKEIECHPVAIKVIVETPAASLVRRGGGWHSGRKQLKILVIFLE